MNPFKKSAALLVVFSIAISVPFPSWSQQTTGFKVLNDYKIASPGGWDYILVDGANKRVYVSHGTQVNVISTTGDSLVCHAIHKRVYWRQDPKTTRLNSIHT